MTDKAKREEVLRRFNDVVFAFDQFDLALAALDADDLEWAEKALLPGVTLEELSDRRDKAEGWARSGLREAPKGEVTCQVCYDGGGCYVEWYTDDDGGSGNGEHALVCRWYGENAFACEERAMKPPPPLREWVPLIEPAR